jgi:hypothetical protein
MKRAAIQFGELHWHSATEDCIERATVNGTSEKAENSDNSNEGGGTKTENGQEMKLVDTHDAVRNGTPLRGVTGTSDHSSEQLTNAIFQIV